MSLRRPDCNLYICSYCNGIFPLSSFYNPSINHFSPICSSCRVFAVGSYDSSQTSSPDITRKRSSNSLDSLDSSMMSKSASLSSELRLGLSESPSSPAIQQEVTQSCVRVCFKPENKIKIKAKTYSPTHNGYHYVVPRSCWICNTVKMSKQKMKEVYQATLVYHRGVDQLEDSLSQPRL